MINFIVGTIIVLMVGLAIAYIVKEKKRGVKCVGCPMAGTCSGHHHSPDHVCTCGHDTETHSCHCHANAI